MLLLTKSLMEMYSPWGLCRRDDHFRHASPTVLQAVWT